MGGINSNGDAVTGTAQNGNRFLPSEPLGLANADKASNYGNCVDIWAPAERIYSTWGYGDGVSEATSTLSGPPSVPWYTNNPPYSGQQPSNYVAPQHFSANGGYRGWGWLSGTSMAAPHVAAAAAYVIAKYQLSTPAAAEQKLRDLANQYGSFGKFDLLNNPVRVVNLGP